MKLGGCTTSPKVLELFKKYGFTCFESNFQSIRGMSEEDLETLRTASEENGVRMEGMSCFMHYDHRLLSWADDELDAYFEEGVKRAKPLGLCYVVIGSGGARKVPEGMTKAAALDKFAKVLSRFGAIAERYDVDVYLEPLRTEETDMINTVTESIALCRRANHPRVTAMADFYHMSTVGEPFEHCKDPMVSHLHISTADRRIPMLSDRAEWETMLRYIKEKGYTGRLVWEGNAEPDLETALREFSELVSTVK